MAAAAEQGERLQAALDELAEARSLLTAIAELAVVPQPEVDDDYSEYERAQRAFTTAQRDRAICVHVAAAAAHGFRAAETTLRRAGTEDLGYQPKPNIHGFAPPPEASL